MFSLRLELLIPTLCWVKKPDVINNETTVTKKHFIVCYFIIICPFIKMKNTEQSLSLSFSRNQSEKLLKEFNLCNV